MDNNKQDRVPREDYYVMQVLAWTGWGAALFTLGVLLGSNT